MAVSIAELLAEIEKLKERLEKYEPSGLKLKNFRLEEGADKSITLRYDEKGEGDWHILTFTKEGQIILFEGIHNSKVFKTNKRGCVKIL